MPLMNTLMKLARSPQGRRMATKAARYASSPQGKAKIAQTRERLASRRAKRIR